MTARILLILGKTRGHRPRLQVLLHEFCNSLNLGGEWGNPRIYSQSRLRYGQNNKKLRFFKPMTSTPIRALCFYLPQFHPVPENDEWWGKGFTEWRNVVKAKPLFPGHQQPQLPRDLGFYDLRVPESREAQAVLARKYGVYGFCYYHYWFNGRRILERPVDDILSLGKPDFPFCLCWAN